MARTCAVAPGLRYDKMKGADETGLEFHSDRFRDGDSQKGLGMRDGNMCRQEVTVWEEIEREYLDEFDTFVAHNAAFDRSCLLQSAELYRIHLPELKWMCSLQTARRIYSFGCNRLGYLCEQLGIHEGTHHRAGDDAEMCARLYLRELDDMKKTHNSEFHGKH